MMEMIRRIFRPAPAEAKPQVRQKILVRSNLSEPERAELRRWAKRRGIAKYQDEPDGSDLEATAAKTIRAMEQNLGKWGK